MKNKLPAEYITDTTIEDIQLLKSKIIRSIEKTLLSDKNFHYIHVPLYVNSSTGLNSYWKTGFRAINFDTLYDSEISEVLQGVNKWLRYYATINKIAKGTTLVTSNIFCVRDSERDPTGNNIKTKINTFTVGKSISGESGLDFEANAVINVIEKGINNVVEEYSSITKPMRKFFTVEDDVLAKSYGHLLYFERIKRITQEKRNILLRGVWPFYEKKRPVESLIFDEWYWKEQGKYFSYYPKIKNTLTLFQIGEAVSARDFSEQAKKLSINIENKQNLYYDMLKEDKLVKGSMREINIDELIMLLLQKVNIAEICPTNLDLKFKMIAKKKKINFV